VECLDGYLICSLVGSLLEGGVVTRSKKMVPTCLFWCLWQERNNRCFEDLERSLEGILSSCFHTFVSLDCSVCVPIVD
jgi:hypothetical protein